MIEVEIERLTEALKEFRYESEESLREELCPFNYECEYCAVIFPEWSENYIEYYSDGFCDRTSCHCPCYILGVDFVAGQVERFLGENQSEE